MSLKKHLKTKLLLANLVILVTVAGIYFGISQLTKYAPYISFVLFFIFSAIALRQILHVPLEKILREMKSLLTGKNFRKIYTARTDEIGILGHFFNEITSNLEKISHDIKEHQRISEELNLAQKIQHDLIPHEAPAIPGLEITAKTKSAAEIGGDSFDFLPQEKQTFFYLGDVTGHGIPAGLVMIMVDTLINTFATMSETGKDLLVNVNKFLKPRLQPNMFMTIVMMRWLHEEQKMHFAGGGHEYLLHFKAQEGKCDAIMSGGIAIGMLPDVSAVIKEQEIDFEKGDYIVLYTDGITECKNVSGEQFTMEKLQSLIEEKAKEVTNTKDLFGYLAQEVTIFAEGHVQEDDMSLIVIKNTGGEQAEIPQESTDWEKDGNNLPQPPKEGKKEPCEPQTSTTTSPKNLSPETPSFQETPQG